MLPDRSFVDLLETQLTFDPLRQVHISQCPHEATGLAVPASRYRASARSFAETLPPLEYAAGVQVRRASTFDVI